MQFKKLNTGQEMPVLGLGTWKSLNGTVAPAVEYALTKSGYTHIDCAPIYRNEKEVGKAFSKSFASGIKRENIFITSKLWNTDHKAEYVEKACRQTISDLQLEYLDLYLMHWGVAFEHSADLEPVGKDGHAKVDKVRIQETWQAMEELVEKGLVKAIGVANFTTIMLVDLLTYAKIIPVVNQIELHPYNTQEELLKFCENKSIAVTAYSPLGRQGTDREGPRIFDEKVIKDLTKKYNKTEGQVLLRWGIQRDTIVIPKSIHTEKIDENIAVFGFALTDEEMRDISALNKNYRFVNPVRWWGFPYFS